MEGISLFFEDENKGDDVPTSKEVHSKNTISNLVKQEIPVNMRSYVTNYNLKIDLKVSEQASSYIITNCNILFKII